MNEEDEHGDYRSPADVMTMLAIIFGGIAVILVSMLVGM